MSRRDELVAFYAEQGWMARERRLTPLQARLVQMLADGEAHSSRELAAALGMTEDGVAHLVSRVRARFGRSVLRSDRRWGYWVVRPLSARSARGSH